MRDLHLNLHTGELNCSKDSHFRGLEAKLIIDILLRMLYGFVCTICRPDCCSSYEKVEKFWWHVWRIRTHLESSCWRDIGFLFWSIICTSVFDKRLVTGFGRLIPENFKLCLKHMSIQVGNCVLEKFCMKRALIMPDQRLPTQRKQYFGRGFAFRFWLILATHFLSCFQHH